MRKRELFFLIGLWSVVIVGLAAWDAFHLLRGWRETNEFDFGSAGELAVEICLWVGGIVGTFWLHRRMLLRGSERTQLLAEVVASEERWRSALDAAGDGVWDWNTQTDILYRSPRWKAMLGYAGNEIGDQLSDWESRVHPEDHSGAMAILERHLAGETPVYQSEHRVRCKDGNYKWILARGRVVSRSPEGRPLRVIGTHQDLSAQKQIEIARQESERRYRQLLASITNYVYSVELVDGQPHSTTHSPGCLAVTGYTAAEYAANPLLWIEMVPLAEQAAVVAHSAAALRGELTDPLEHRIRHKDGAIRWVRSTLVPRHNVEGKLIAFDGLVQDITERKQTDDALRESEARYRLVADNTGDVIWLFDFVANHFTFVSPSVVKLTGYTVDESLRLGLQDTMPVTSVAEATARLATRLEALAAGDESARTRTFGLQLRRKDGSVVNTELVTTLITDTDGRVTHLQGTTRDITARKQSEDELRRISRWLEHTQRISRVGGWTIELATSKLWFSIEARRIYGLGDGEFTLADIQKVPLPEYRPALDRAMRDLVEHGILYDIEIQIRRPADGAVLDIHSVAELSPEGDTVIGVIHDITARKLADAALRESEHVLQESQKVAALGSYSLDIAAAHWTSSVILDEIFGIDDQFDHTTSSWLSLIAPADRSMMTDYFTLEVLGKGQRFDKQYRIVREKDGAERWVHGLGQLEFNAEHLPVRMLGTIQDITARKLAELALSDSEQRYRLLVENSSFPVIVSTLTTGRLLFVNQRAKEFYELDEHSGAPDLWTNPPDRTKLMEELIAGHVIDRREVALRSACGTPLRVEVSARLLEFDGQQAIFSVHNDVTARVRAEAELRKLSHAVEQSPVTVIITDLTGAIEYVNPSFTATTGYTFEEARGRNPRILRSGHLSAEVYREMWQAITTGHEWRGEFHNRRKNGELFWEAATISPITDEAGRITQFLAVKENITERKVAADRIREQAALLEVTQDAIVVLNLERVIEYWNRGAEKLYGVNREQALGQRYEAIAYRELPVEFELDWRRFLANGEWSVERRHVSRQRGEIIVQKRATLVRDEQGGAKSALLVITDITEAKHLESQLLRAQRLESLGSLASGVAHDLNNVLAPILLSTGLLATSARSPRERELIELVGDSARRGAEIVKQLLLFGRGNDSPRSPMSVATAIKDLVQMMRETFPKNLVISTCASSDLWMIDGDRTQVHQVLLNLCVNARDAMPAGGKLAVLAENHHVDPAFAARQADAKPGPHVAIRVKDTGSGISRENQEKIFDPFFTTKPIGQGTGLGLATVLSIVRNHGGFVTVESQPGAGTEFAIFLPARASAAAAIAAEQGQNPLHGQGELVLLIDDEASIRSALGQVLTTHHYDIVVAGDGAEGLALFTRHAQRVKLVITDIMMPVMDGMQAIRALRQHNPTLPIIAISGVLSQRAELETKFGPHIRFLPKPFAAEMALSLARELLDRSLSSASAYSPTAQ